MTNKEIKVDKEFLDRVLKLQEDLKEEVEQLKKQLKTTGRASEIVRQAEEVVSRVPVDLKIRGVISHQHIPTERQREFFRRLRDLMLEYKVLKAEVILAMEL